jgi:hypothetical protein
MSSVSIKQLPPEWQAELREEHRQGIRAAAVFARICKEGDADRLYAAHQFLNESGPDAWRLAMRRLAKFERVSPEIQNAFVSIWIESKMLPLRVGNRSVLARALRVLMPGASTTSPITLYRGTSHHERRYHRYGFSWTTDLSWARQFAEKWAQPVPALTGMTGPAWGGVVLQTEAPPEAILLVRPPEGFYDEGEVVVDPFALNAVKVVERLNSERVRP